MQKNKIKIITAYITSIASFLIINFWTYWGINEAFHEGWYHTSLTQNILLTLTQYLSIPIILLTITIIAINYKKIGTTLILATSIFTLFFFKSNAGRILIFIPLLLFAAGFYFGKFKNKKIIIYSIIISFIIIVSTFGIPQMIRVENRYNDNDFGLKTIYGNEINLTWAPQGEGFPLKGTDWETAKEICSKLNENANHLNDNATNIWRLPTKEEIIKSLTKNNTNAKGHIDNSGITQYQTKPDKETPLWNPNSQIIYYWTSDSANEETAYLVAYNGIILQRNKNSAADYQGYRCVKN